MRICTNNKYLSNIIRLILITLIEQVNCGGHPVRYRPSCARCSDERVGCNGDCQWNPKRKSCDPKRGNFIDSSEKYYYLLNI